MMRPCAFVLKPCAEQAREQRQMQAMLRRMAGDTAQVTILPSNQAYLDLLDRDEHEDGQQLAAWLPEHAWWSESGERLNHQEWPLWRAIRPVLEGLAGDEARFAGVRTLGVDEHVVRREALLFRMEVRDHHRRVVVAAR